MAIAIARALTGAVLVLLLLGVIGLAVSRPPLKLVARYVGCAIGAIAALYLVGRAVAELFTVDYSDPSSYQHSWGGPSLFGVVLVHSGPGALIVVAVLGYMFRRWQRSPSNRGESGRTRERRAEAFQRIREVNDAMAARGDWTKATEDNENAGRQVPPGDAPAG